MKLKAHWQILIAVGLGVGAGLFSIRESAPGFDGIRFLPVYQLIGDLFLNALKMIIVPLILSAIISSISGFGGEQGLGRIGIKALLIYLTTSLSAILVALTLVTVISPGLINGQAAKYVVSLPKEVTADDQKKITNKDASTLKGVLTSLIPTNIVAAAADNHKLLGLIFFSLLFALFITRLTPKLREVQISFWQSFFEVMMAMTQWVMRFAPVGVFGLVAAAIAGLKLPEIEVMAGMMMRFFLTVTLGLAIHAFILLPLILLLIGRANPLAHFRAVAPALLTAFSTASSAATVPVTLECVERNAGVSKRTTSVLIPLGATVNMDGTALYECVAAVFIAQAYGVDLSFSQLFVLGVVALLTSFGMAGIPAASLVAISVILAIFNVPLEGIGLLLIVDRLLDMLRTAVNVLSDTVVAVTVAKTEGEEQVLRTRVE